MKLKELFKKVITYVKNVWNKLFKKEDEIIVTVDTKPIAAIVEPSTPPKPTPKTTTAIVEPTTPPMPTKP